MMFRIFFAVVPSPKGFVHVRGLVVIALAADKILSGLVPASMLAPTATVSGRSVLSRRVTQGTCRMQVSSWTPPESVRTSLALLCSTKNAR